MDSIEKETLASEIYSDLKQSNKFQRMVIICMAVVIAFLGLVNCVQGMYHEYLWSQYDTVVVDSGEGDGNANYVQGDNNGGIYNGESGSTP